MFVKGLLIKGFEMRDKVRTYLKQVGTLWGLYSAIFGGSSDHYTANASALAFDEYDKTRDSAQGCAFRGRTTKI